ncbi:MAG: hypothetical protein LBO72_00420, partial [Helicobacteraceae bacterium]|nr:hypothetical protein [Helicobacteraceae bacterium]
MGFVRVFATIIVAFSALFAAGENPSTLGLEVGKSTIADAKAKYSLKSTGINRYSEGEQFEIDVSGVKLDGATKAFIIFDKNGKLAAIVIE